MGRVHGTYITSNIGPEDIDCVFHILDADHSGDVSHEEFAQQLWKMKSQETRTLLMFVKYYVLQTWKKLNAQMNELQQDTSIHNQENSKAVGNLRADLLSLSKSHNDFHDVLAQVASDIRPMLHLSQPLPGQQSPLAHQELEIARSAPPSPRTGSNKRLSASETCTVVSQLTGNHLDTSETMQKQTSDSDTMPGDCLSDSEGPGGSEACIGVSPCLGNHLGTSKAEQNESLSIKRGPPTPMRAHQHLHTTKAEDFATGLVPHCAGSGPLVLGLRVNGKSEASSKFHD